MDIVERLRDVFSGNALKDISDQTQVYIKERYEAADEIARLREALQSIANNTCCDKCQEATLVARAALQQNGSE